MIDTENSSYWIIDPSFRQRLGGVLRVRLEGSRVFITGNAVLFMKSEIPFDLIVLPWPTEK